MHKYQIEHRLKTKAECTQPFIIKDYKFEHWEVKHGEGCLTDYWSVTKDIEANTWSEAYKEFFEGLMPLLSRISFVSQCAMDIAWQPFLIANLDQADNVIFLEYTKDIETCSLMFRERDVENLEKIIDKGDDDFFLFMMHSSNALYIWEKLALLFSAIESLTKGTLTSTCSKCGDVRTHNGADKEKLKVLLGDDLYKKCWGGGGLRHKLSHGTYPTNVDGDLAEKVYWRVIKCLNAEYDLDISESVVSPQRSFYGQKELGRNFYLCTVDKNPPSLKFCIEKIDELGLNGDEIISFIPRSDSKVKNF